MSQQLNTGWTEPIRTELLVDAQPAPVDGKLYRIFITDSMGTTRTLDTEGEGSEELEGCELSVATVEETTVATFTPESSTLIARYAPYRVHFMNVTDGYVLPSGAEAEIWEVYDL